MLEKYCYRDADLTFCVSLQRSLLLIFQKNERGYISHLKAHQATNAHKTKQVILTTNQLHIQFKPTKADKSYQQHVSIRSDSIIRYLNVYGTRFTQGETTLLGKQKADANKRKIFQK